MTSKIDNPNPNPNPHPGYPYWVLTQSAYIDPGISGFENKVLRVLCVEPGIMEAYISNSAENCAVLAQADYPLETFEGPRPADPTDVPAGGGPTVAPPIIKNPGILITIPFSNGTTIQIFIPIPVSPPDGSYPTSKF